VPISARDLLDSSLESLTNRSRIGHTQIDKIQTNPTDTGGLQGIEFRVRGCVIDKRYAPRSMPELPECIEHARVINTVDQGVNNNNSIQVQRTMQRKGLPDRGNFWRVSSAGPKRKALRITEYVRVAITCVRGDIEVDGGCGLRSGALHDLRVLRAQRDGDASN
jgi:hypothetical protein